MFARSCKRGITYVPCVALRGKPALLTVLVGTQADDAEIVSWCATGWFRYCPACTRYRTVGMGKRVRSMTLYHSRQCDIVLNYARIA